MKSVIKLMCRDLKRTFGLRTLGIWVVMALMAGCGQQNTVESFVVSNSPLEEKADIEDATQPEKVSENETVYASVYFIESPKGMEYTAKWYLDDTQIKTDVQKTTTDMAGVMVYSLEADQVAAGTLKFEVTYNDDILCSQELIVE